MHIARVVCAPLCVGHVCSPLLHLLLCARLVQASSSLGSWGAGGRLGTCQACAACSACPGQWCRAERSPILCCWTIYNSVFRGVLIIWCWPQCFVCQHEHWCWGQCFMLAHTVKCHCDSAARGCLSRLGFSVSDMLELISYWGFVLMAWTLISEC